jgi:tRNA uridine 5-carboxymethylaminomethyl modification enzyme
LVTRGVGGEPYRIFTSRAEHRLLFRESNADERLGPLAHRVGLINARRYDRLAEKQDSIFAELQILEAAGLAAELRKPSISYQEIAPRRRRVGAIPSPEIRHEVECRLKYAGYIARQEREVARFRDLEDVVLPRDLDYAGLVALSTEVREKLARVNPETLGQASRIPGVTPAALSVLSVLLKRETIAGAKPQSVATQRS